MGIKSVLKVFHHKRKPLQMDNDVKLPMQSGKFIRAGWKRGGLLVLLCTEEKEEVVATFFQSKNGEECRVNMEGPIPMGVRFSDYVGELKVLSLDGSEEGVPSMLLVYHYPERAAEHVEDAEKNGDLQRILPYCDAYAMFFEQERDFHCSYMTRDFRGSSILSQLEGESEEYERE